MNQNRAYSLMQVKAVDDEARTITGIASTPTPDRYGDVVVPEGVKFKLPIPLLWQHDHALPIGVINEAEVTAKGILIKATIPKPSPDAPSQLVARLAEAWESIKTGLVRGLSIGFKPIDYTASPEGGLRITEWDLMEVSAVTVPANAECTIRLIKSIDSRARAAIGNPAPETPNEKKSPAGVAAKPTNNPKGKKMNVAEQIKSFEAKRAALAAERDDVMQKSFDEGRTLDVEETERYDNVNAEIKSVDAHLSRLREMEKGQVETAKPVIKGYEPVEAGKNRAPGIIKVEQKLDKGIGFARYAKSLAAARGSRSDALAFAKQFYPEDAKLHHVIKAGDPIVAGSTSDPKWAGSLVEYQEYVSDFVEYLRPQTIVGRFGNGGIPSLRRVPFNVRIPKQVSGGSASWVGEGKAKPLTQMEFGTITFGWAKIAAIAVLTDELVRFSNPSADALVRNALAEAVIERLDTDFIDPAKKAVDGVSPASITNGVTALPSAGDPDKDIEAAFASFIAANLTPANGVWIMSSTLALSLSMMRNALGQKRYPDLTLLGGSFGGLPVIVSQYVPGDSMILVNASDIYLADDGQVAIDASREASLEMLAAPTMDSVAGTGANVVSMFQTNSVAIRAERWINWQRRRDAAVAVISGIDYSDNGGEEPGK